VAKIWRIVDFFRRLNLTAILTANIFERKNRKGRWKLQSVSYILRKSWTSVYKRLKRQGVWGTKHRKSCGSLQTSFADFDCRNDQNL